MEKIILLHTNDLHSHLENWPKLRRFLLNRKQEETANKRIITVDLGDFVDRWHPLTEATNGQANVQLMNQIHYDAATIGNNEGVGNSKAELNQLILGGFVLAIAATKSGLDVLMAKTLIAPFGKRSENVLLGFMLITGIFSMFISNTATAAMMHDTTSNFHRFRRQ